MKLFNKSNLKYILLAIIIILILFLTAIKTKSEQPTIPITYDFYNSNILDKNQEDIPEYYNVKEQSEYKGNYIAWNSFDNSLDEDLYSYHTTGSSNIEITDYYGHTNVINATNSGDGIGFDILFEKASVINISFWFSISNGSIQQYFVFQNSTSFVSDNYIGYYYTTNNILYFSRGGGSDFISNILNDVWYHTTVSIDCTNDLLDVWFDYELIVNDVSFFNFADMDFVYYFLYANYNPHDSYVSVYLDGFDISISYNWNFFRSRIPETELTDYLEVDKYEFDYDVNNFENDFYDWKEFGYLEDYCDTYIYSESDIENQIIINSSYGSGYTNGFTYENINLNSMIINITLDMEILSDYISGDFYHLFYFYDMSNTSHYFSYFYFDTQTEVVKLYDTNLQTMEYWFDYSDNHNYLFNIYINYYDNILIYSVIDLENNNNYMYNCSFPQIYHYQESYGLSKILIDNYCLEIVNPSDLIATYYSIGIYENGKSIIKNHNTYEFGLLNYEIEESWNSDNHNLLIIDSYNTYDIFVHNYYEYYLDGYKILEILNQTSILNINLADQKDNNYPKFSYENSYLILRLYGNFTNPFEIKVDGIQLIDNFDNTYYGNYYYNDIDTDYNWFYCIDNKLYYNFNNNNTLGTMRITFNVNDILLNNESIISYSSFIYDNYSGNINLISYHLTESFEIFNNDSLIYSYQNITDTENFILSSITIEINCNNLTSDLAKGYIQNINIYPDKSLFPEFDDIDYLESSFLEKIIETIIPLLFFIIPALILRTRFGFKSVLPFWILLTIVFLFTNFIPFWICFIIFLSIALMVLNKESEVIE